jgi:hypothetical protein
MKLGKQLYLRAPEAAMKGRMAWIDTHLGKVSLQITNGEEVGAIQLVVDSGVEARPWQ